MLKDPTRDYVVYMFRFYASLNCPNKEEIHKHKEKLSNPQILDLLAVEKSLNEFSDDIKNAVRSIYFINPTEKPRQNEITERVVNYSIKNYLAEGTVWKYLKQARYICAKHRELNTDFTVKPCFFNK